MKQFGHLLLSFVGLLTPLLSSGCGSSAGSSFPISVGFTTGGPLTIGQGQSATIVAEVTNDSSGKGVTWNLAGPGTLTKQTSLSVEYDAPASVTSNGAATVTATSVADPTKLARFTLNLGVIAVSVSPATASVPVNTAQDFSATVSNDGTNAGVRWSLTQGNTACSPACGTLTLATTLSGASTTYMPPAAVPTNTAVTLTATAVADSTKTGTAAIIIAAALPISVSISPGSTSVTTGTVLQFTGIVTHDTPTGGINWSLTQAGVSCAPGCGSIAPANTPDGASTNYTAPATVPNNAAVTLTATSTTDPSQSASITITVIPPPISVAVTPTSVLMGINTTQDFTATVQNDPADKGVTWSLTQSGAACSPACGTIAPASTASGVAVTYTAPAAALSSTLNLTATSVSDPTISNCVTRCVTITVTNGTVKLIPANVNFGRVPAGTTAHEAITLTNTGTSALTITGISITGGGTSVFSQTNTCGGSIDAGSSCGITAGFSPVSTIARSSADIVIADSSADSPQQISMTGKGSAALPAAIKSALSSTVTVSVPAPTGASSVGTRVMRMVDSSRQDPYLVNGTPRELLVRFWYPASLAGSCTPAEYASPKVWSYFSELADVHLPTVRTNSCLDAPAAEGKHPILVFTHGYTGTFTDYTFLFEDLASRGYVVASVDHTYEASAVEFPDGRLAESVPGSYVGQISGNTAQEVAFAVLVRLDDLKFVIGELDRLNADGSGAFVQKLDTSRLAVGGHSLGGLTALLAAQTQPRFKAAVLLDAFVPQAPASEVTTPTLLLAAGDKQWSDAERNLWGELRGGRFVVNFLGSEHVTPTDFVWLAKDAVKTGKMGPEKTIAAMRDYVAAFLDVSLRRQPASPLLSGISSDYPDVDLTPPSPSLSDRK